MKYELVLGLEVHIQSKTKSKMFCGCSTDYFGKKPNTHTCPVCLGLPGALPVPNEEAIKLCAKLGLALNCTIAKETKFDRKNYFYTDLPKGYQISQYDQPISSGGYIDVDVDGTTKRIGITRVHQEEDTGKSVYVGEETHLDYNKSGVPLIEVVTEPDFRSIEEVLAFARELRLLVRFLGVSDADMEKGQMRFEPNISLRKKGEKRLAPYKVEVKNIGSIAVLENVVKSEIERQSELLDNGKTPVQETRGLVDMSGATFSQRTKETEADYRYFPEPDIPPIVFSDEDIKKIRKSLPKKPSERRKEYDEMGLDTKTIDFLVNNVTASDHFEKVISSNRESSFVREVAKLIIQTWSIAKEQGVTDVWSSFFDPQFFVELANSSLKNELKGYQIKKTLDGGIEYWQKTKETIKSPSLIIKKKGIESIDDEDILSSAADKAIDANPKAVDDYKQNPNAIMFLVGQVMKEMKGKSDPGVVRKILEEKLK